MSRIGAYVLEQQEISEQLEITRGQENEYINSHIRRVRQRQDSQPAQHESSGHPAYPGGEKATALPF